jgi:transposase
MYRHQITQVKMNIMRKRFIDEKVTNITGMAKELKISKSAAFNYIKEFQRIKDQFPERLADMDFYMPEPKKGHIPTALYVGLVPLLPVLLSEEQTTVLKQKDVWRKYRQLYPNGYSYSAFKRALEPWLLENVIKVPVNLINTIPEQDLKQLEKWRHSNIHRNWQIAATLKAASTGSTVTQIMDKVDAVRITINRWLMLYRTKGLEGFELMRKPREPVLKRMQDRKDKLVKILHESPKLHGLNRTSWSIRALTDVYNRVYKTPASYMQLSHTLKQLGYSYKKSRDMMTSQDPKFREKIKKIQSILRHLKPNEKFFSIDEFGPVSVKIKGGVMLKQKMEQPRVVPTKQKSKGRVICTAAVELSTNQVSHFYSLKKNTFEMIKLIDLLLVQYKDQERLYLSWDDVSWHRSKILLTYIDDLNQEEYRSQFRTPEIKLAPLPSCTQFLNVIESVFAGLAKAVIHNSDYDSVDTCKEAITLHFETRNKHFLANPKRAGKKIWGKELVAPKFSETQHCRRAHAMRGAR